MALALCPMKELFHTPIRPSSTGRLLRRGASKKCVSMLCAPARNCCTTGNPYCSERGTTPTAEETEKRPPTQSQKPNTLSAEMPKAVALGMAVLTAIMCWRMTSAGAPCTLSSSHFLMVRALSMVSAVVKVFETTITRVLSASRPLSALETSTGSTFARKRRVRPAARLAATGSVRSASNTNSGPRKDPPMPTATTVCRGLPVAPSHSPLRTLSVKAAIFCSTACTSGTTSAPSTTKLLSFGERRATCITARSSVALMCTPAAILARLSSSPAAPARSYSMSMVSGCMFSLLKSSRMPSCSAVRDRQRSLSCISSRRWVPWMLCACSSSLFHWVVSLINDMVKTWRAIGEYSATTSTLDSY
mmetsp:Transcript_25757/g.57013  ORF Transcript_25757/g.57013 Transcript_25757/m.57013 type:complete len:361 (-) Transcript_25757:43-1125(-)